MAARDLPTSSFGVLGMVSMTPMSGYELAQAVQRSIAHFWPMSKTQVYSELSRLESLGYVDATEVAQERLPDKRVYSLTEAGAAALDAWLEAPTTEGPTFRLPLLVKVFFAHRMPRETLLELLDGVEAECAEDVQVMEKLVEILGQVPKAVHAWATAMMGLRMGQATLTWAQEVRARLAAEEPHPAEVEDAELFRAMMRQAPAFSGWRGVDRAARRRPV